MTTYSDAPAQGTTDPDDLARLEAELKEANAAIQPLRDDLAIQTEGVAGPRERLLDLHRAERQAASATAWAALKALIVAVFAAFAARRQLKRRHRHELNELNAKLEMVLTQPKRNLDAAIAHRDELDRQVRTLKVRLADLKASELVGATRPTWKEVAKPKPIQPVLPANGLAGYALSHAQSLADDDTQLIETVQAPPAPPVNATTVAKTNRRALPTTHGPGGWMIPIKSSVGTIIVSLSLAVALGIIVIGFVSFHPGSPTTAPQVVPTPGPTKVQTAVAVPNPSSTSATPSASPSATPLTLDELFAQKSAKDNNLALWLMASAPAQKALAPWQPYIAAAVSDPSTAYTAGGQSFAVMGTKVTTANGQILWTHGRQPLLYLLCLTGSGGNPAFQSGSYAGLIPLDIATAKAAASEMGIAYVPAAPTVEAARNNVYIATYLANKIYAEMSTSTVFAATIKAIEDTATANAQASHVQNYVATQDPKVIAQESDLYTTTFFALWFGEMNISNGIFALQNGLTKDDLPILTEPGMSTGKLNQMLHRLYLDWGLKQSRQADILFALPSVKTLLAQAIKARATLGSR